MSAYSIDCKRYKLNGTQSSLGQDKTIMTSDNKEIHLTLYIDCEGDEDNNSFTFEQYGDNEMVVERNRCELDIYIKENKTIEDKYFTIICTHSNDSSIFINIKIVQIAEEYKLMFSNSPTCAGPTNIAQELKSIITVSTNSNDKSNYNYYEQVSIDVCVVGGSKKYRIESIVKCHEEPEEVGGEQQYIYSSFDNGFTYVKKPNRLIIRNYGRPFLEENDYYVITLCHEDYRQKKATIKLTYSQVPQSEGTGHHDEPQIIHTRPQESNIYRTHNYIVHETEETEEIGKVCQLIMNDTTDDIQINEKGYEIVGQVDVILSFKVLLGENESSLEPSNLMVRVCSHGNWCSVVLIEEDPIDLSDRKIKISILDKPICERKTIFSISVVDYPDATKSFVLTNLVESQIQ